MSRRTSTKQAEYSTPPLFMKVPMKVLEFISGLFAALVLLLTPIHPVIISVGVLIFADAFIGIWAAYKRGERISSKRMGDSIVKMLVYQLVLISGYLVQTYLLSDFIPVVKLAAGYIGMVELKSLLENSSTILGRDIFKEIISKLGSKSDKNPDDKV